MLYLLIIIAILVAVTIALVLQHGGQRSIPLIATSLVEVNGVATYLNANGTLEVWDASDVTPTSLENGATFLTTSFLRWKQQRGNCSGLVPCAGAPDCSSASNPVASGGVQTGTCLPSGYCEVQAWCPVENPATPTPISELDGVLDFTLFIRNFVGIPSTNDGFDTGTEQVHNWNYFLLSDLLRNTSLNYDQIRHTGAVLALSYDYDCEIDFNTAEKCKTKAKTRVLALGKGKTPETSSGFSIYTQNRFERYNATSDNYYVVRQLNKFYGVRYEDHRGGFCFQRVSLFLAILCTPIPSISMRD